MTKAVIAGGGIAGTVAAMALEKAGIEAVVCESYDRTADGVGAYLTLAVNGIRALGVLGLDDVVGGLGFATPTMAMHLGSGQKLAEFPFADEPYRTIRRSDLYQALRAEAERRGIEVRYGKRIVDAEPGPNGVRARFADGSTVEADLLIGADGLRSRVREIIDPAAPPARYVPLLNTGGFARRIEVDGGVGVMNMVFGRKAFFAWFRSPDDEIWWFANPPMRREPAPGVIEAIPQAQWRAELTELFAADRSPAVDIIAATPGDLPKWATYDFPSVPRWHRDRMVIIGDAAHAVSPASGQGASMAIEDAVVLAKCLRDAPDVDAAFRAYEEARRERVERIVAQGKKNGDQKALNPVMRILRDMFLKRMATRPQPAGADPLRWMWDHPLDWESPALPAA